MTQQKTEDADADRRRLVDEARAAREQARALSDETVMAVYELRRSIVESAGAREGPARGPIRGNGTFAAAGLSTGAPTERMTRRWTENVAGHVRFQAALLSPEFWSKTASQALETKSLSGESRFVPGDCRNSRGGSWGSTQAEKA